MDKRALKIWVMTQEYHPNIIGGLGIVATQITNMLHRNGAAVTVICKGRSGQFRDYKTNGSLHVLALPDRKSSGLYPASNVLAAISRSGAAAPDLIHVHSTQFAAAAIAASKKYRAPIVYTCHSLSSTGLSSREGRHQTMLFRAARKITVPSRWLAAESGKRYPGARGKIVVIPNGVKYISDRIRQKPAYNLLYAGRVIPAKGIEELIGAVARLSRKTPAVKLTIIGDGPKPYMRRERLIAKKLGVANRIRWIRQQSHASLLRKYAGFGAVVVPSRNESFCLVALESMAQGVPLVTTLSGGLKEFANASNAQIIRVVNKNAIAKSITAVWKNPNMTKRRMINAKKTASRYLWPRIVRKYTSLFNNLRKRG